MSALTDRHPHLLTLSDELFSCGKWQDWSQNDPRLAGLADLTSVVDLRQTDRSERVYLAVAALTARGSRRGGDDDDAAMAVVLLLQHGIGRLVHDLNDQCELDDVMCAVWEAVKRAAPDMGHMAPRFLLARAKDLLLSPVHGAVGATRGRFTVISMDDLNDDAGMDLPQLAGEEDACRDLTDLLEWARTTGVLGQADVDLVLDLVAATHACGQSAMTEHVEQVVGEWHGVVARTVRRRRAAAVRRLQQATPAYLAEVS